MNWLKKKLISLMIATSKSEGIVNTTGASTEDSGMHQRHQEGLLAQSLVQGVMTQEVKELRWRIYKIEQHSQDNKTKVTGFDDNGYPLIETVKVNRLIPDNYEVDNIDVDIHEQKLKIVFDNKEIDLNLNSSLTKSEKEDADITLSEYLTAFKGEKSLFIERGDASSFNIEKYTKKLLVYDTKDDDTVLLDFYVSKYHDVDDRRSRLFLSEIKKVMNGKRLSGITDFQKVSFITHHNLGVKDNLEYEFEIEKFDKIFFFKDSYVIRFLAKTTIDGDDVLNKFKLDDLDEKYDKKDRK
jgi:hypothetical protein